MMINQIKIDASAQSGLLFPIKAINTILNGANKNTEKIEFEELKGQILSYLEVHKRAYISDMIEHFNVPLEIFCQALEELEKEKRIR